MTENDRGTPNEPEPDRETPPTQPLPEPEPAATPEPGPAATPEPEPAATPEPEPAATREPMPGSPPSPDASAPYGMPGAPAAYGQPGAPAASQYGYAPSPPKNDLAVWSLITGILSFVFCPLLLGIAAIITGNMSRKAADEGLANNRGMGTAGLILGWVNVALVALGIVFFFIALAVGLFAGGIGFNEWDGPRDMNGY